MKQNIIILILISLGVISLAQLTIQITNQCECSQFHEYSCGSNYNTEQCQWNSSKKICEPVPCKNLNTQSNCLKNYVECYWDGTQCQQFQECSNLNPQNLSCTNQNIQCYSLNNSTSSCQSLDELPYCYSLNQDECALQTIGYGGTPCIWNQQNNTCQTVSNCNQLSMNQCLSFSNACFWDGPFNSCVQQSCYNLNQASCTYVLGVQNMYTIMPCIFEYGYCQPIQKVSQLSAENCSLKTLQTYYWIQDRNSIDNRGICIPCNFKINNIISIYNPKNSCPCSNFQIEQCEQSTYCLWQNSYCIQLSCNQISDQLTCIQNSNCLWQLNFCYSNYNGCNDIYSYETQQCLTLTLSCPFFYENQCYPLSENTCALYQQQQSCQSQYGYCYWNQGQCKLVKKCIHITEQRQCQRFSLSCNWKNNKCESFSCQQIQLENLCKYTIPDLYSDEVQPCIWNNGRCENLIDSNNLDSEQCISNTLDTYKWTGSSCVSCSQTNQLISLYLQLPKQCSCFQLYNQQVCEMTSSCIWLYSSCTYQSCQNINQQINCASNPQCAWISGQCQPFKICNELFGTSQQECILLSVNCPASNGITCQDKKSLKPCSNYQNQSSCANSLGNNGLCFWQNNSCQVLSKCQQITQQQDCQYFSKQCTWTTNCQSIGCSSFNTQATCQYYYSSINSYTPIPCYWNSISGVCAQTTNFMTQLSASTCSINTRLTAQWSYTLNSCLSCQTPNSVNPYQCSCSQIISQINCLQSLQCTWNAQNNQCQQLPCTNLIQSLCIQNSQCMWTGTCQSFSSCTNLIATNSQECQAQSLYCPYYNSNTQKCEVPPLPNPKICLNLTIQECYQIKSCQWNPYEGCQQRNLCNYYSSQIQCVSNPICIWELGCNFKTCNLYISKESCTYTIDLQKQNYIQPCAWINGSCQSTNTVFSEQTCYTNSAFTARWSSNQNDGICIPCNLPIQQQLQPQNQCLCSQLLTEQECNLTECYWENGFCQDFNCYGKSQFNCIQNIQCYWQYSIYDYQNGQCNNIPSLQIVDFCTTLRGKNSLECLAQTKLCPVSLNGICQNRSHLQTCSSMKSLQLCANSVGQEGYCTYKNQQCQVLNNCSQLDNFSECSLFDKICQWNSQTKTCLQIFCSSYTTKDTCTYVFQNINKANIQLCIWNGKSCSSASYIIQKTFSDCYLTTGGTYHWSSTSQTNGNCVSCSLNQIKPKHTCSCTLLNDVECTLAKPVCKLIQNNKCVKSECTEIFDSVHCSQQNECMWKNGSCITFTKCSDLNGTTSLDCIAQSLQCQSVSNSQCQPASSLNSCGQYSNQNCKFGILGSDGFCYWNTSTDNCEVISSCDKVMNISICQQLTPACQWSYYFSSCVPFQCQDYLQQEDCTNVVVNLVDPQILLCVWKNQKCEPFVDTYYRFDNSICYVQSDHTYRWVKDDKLGVQCQQCLQAFFINIITIAILNFF